MQSGNILQIPFRRTGALTLSAAIRNYISNKYDQHPDTFSRDLELIDQLRKDAVNALEPHSSAIKKIQQYAAQLVWMGGKFPVDIGADFTWYPSLGYHTNHAHTENNIRFELANVLFNLAAMYSQLALASNRSTGDGLKSAANNFCFAAGVFHHLKDNVIPDLRSSPPEDMDSATLEALGHLMLAQAQECFWQKAVKDGMKDATIAKLAAKVSDLYDDANEWSMKSDSIRSEWIHHMNAKHHHFAAAAQFRASCDALEKRKYGEELARLRDSLNCVNLALKESTYVNQAVKGDLNGLKNKVAEDLKKAEKDNDTIYLQLEPSKAELQPLDRASMVVARVPPEVEKSQEMLGDHAPLGKPLFAKLVPYSVHVAASIYADRRDRLVNNTVIAELESMTQRIHELLSSLNLPGSLQALEKPLGLPPGLASHAEEVRQSNGVHRLHATIADTEKLKANNRVLYQEGIDLLRTEAGEDEASRRKYGTERWTRPAGRDVVPKLYQQVNDIEGYLKQADASDQMVQTKLRENESLIRLLGGSDRDLEDYVPSSRRATMTAKVEREANALRASLNEVNRLESRRRKKVEALRTKAKEDDVNPDLLKEAARLEREFPMQPVQASQFETLFDRRLTKYDPDQNDLKKEEKEQQTLLDRVTQANTSFQSAKKGDTSSREREEALQNLENAYTAYKDILKNLETGRKFYNDLAAITTRFRDECRNFVYTRRTEAQHLEQDVSTMMQNLDFQERNQKVLMERREQDRAASRRGSVQPVSEINPIPAPMPQRVNQAPPPVANVQTPDVTTWQEGMPIVFGGGGGGGAQQQKGKGKAAGGTWDPSMGVQFGR
ncbi:pH-response regulator protein palA/RIM20 [Fulvia fulva]|uniref:PH-response regulator protein palA/RIM20 n=1 Tax=Passalora fulva TaxID=5499 RepID=A0A9Q8PKU4_PASFU|nr:pH-response regulator protein palA/RIM20 [Fulvia fulva]KAK4610380.1 pH-response regulator protein palA/RIM20 [Fulvia fulva]KAK4610893.1 pH-response regulator protein palA/RIM20 [Fulvia fulva]UJO24366.1 pH-response regulator protein palA/RIM20 [Fulvia fulva]WPV22385.1 pH-response regulator protein palA/RIM20 [Fulvia fulva]WPV36753.1 pH-response regulator protein palA/RIM20 [Fulvia fulva]